MRINKNISSALVALAVAIPLSAPAEAGWDEGVAAFKAGNFSQAAKEFKATVDEQPEWAGGHFMLGWTYLKMNNGQQAVTHLRKSYELNSADVNTQLRLGEAYVQVGRFNDAVAFLSKIDPSSLPKDLQGYLAQLKAVAFTKSGQADRALGEFARAVQANPGSADLQYQYGTAALNAGDTATAVKALGRAVELDGADVDKQRALAQALVIVGRSSQGGAKSSAYQRAAAAAGKVVAANPSFDNLMLLGGAQLGAKQYDGAIGTFERAGAKNSSDWLPSYYVGQAYTAKEQYRSAESTLKQALNKASSAKDQATIWKQLGFVYEKQKNYDEAKLAYNRAGDSAAVRRVDENQKIAQYNEDVQKQNKEIEQLREEQERIEEELKELGRPPRR